MSAAIRAGFKWNFYA